MQWWRTCTARALTYTLTRTHTKTHRQIIKTAEERHFSWIFYWQICAYLLQWRLDKNGYLHPTVLHGWCNSCVLCINDIGKMFRGKTAMIYTLGFMFFQCIEFVGWYRTSQNMMLNILWPSEDIWRHRTWPKQWLVAWQHKNIDYKTCLAVLTHHFRRLIIIWTSIY